MRGWVKARLSEVLQRTATVKPATTPSKEFQYVDVSSVSNATLSIESVERIEGRNAPSRARKSIHAGDVLFAMIRPTLRRIAVVGEDLDGQVCSTAYFVFRPIPAVDNRFLFYWLQSPAFMERMAALQKGASYPAVTESEIRAQSFAYPSPAEQKRIVGILDQAFEAIDAALVNATANALNSNDVYAAYLREVFSPSNGQWVDRPLKEICSFENGDRGVNYPSKRHRTQSGVPFINAGHLADDGLDFEAMDYIPEERFKLLGAGKIRAGDILFCLRGSLGKVASVGSLDRGAIASSLVIVRASEQVIPDFLLAYFHSDSCKHMIEMYAGGAAQPNLSAKSLGEFTIALPPLSEQKKLSANFERVRMASKRLANIYERKTTAISLLKLSLLTSAFQGSL